MEFYYGNPAETGTLIGERQIIAGQIASGSNAQVTVTGWAVPESPDAGKNIYVVADPDLSYEDRNRSNNTANFSIFKPDLEVSQLY